MSLHASPHCLREVRAVAWQLPAPNFSHSIQSAILNLPNIPDRAALDEAGRCAQQVMGDYYPVAAWCDKSTFTHGGWQACIGRCR